MPSFWKRKAKERRPEPVETAVSTSEIPASFSEVETALPAPIVKKEQRIYQPITQETSKEYWARVIANNQIAHKKYKASLETAVSPYDGLPADGYDYYEILCEPAYKDRLEQFLETIRAEPLTAAEWRQISPKIQAFLRERL